jgi:uncharacterized iron-regulated protein
MWYKRMIPLAPAILFCVMFYGCAGMKQPEPIMATIGGVSGHFKIGQILDLKAGTVLSFDEFIERVSPNALIFIGEVHDNPEHHLIEVQILQALVDCCGPVAVAMEFFQEPQQPILNRYIKGELSEEAFLKETKWKHSWGFDYSFYRPLMLLAKHHGYSVLAINAPQDVVRKVARHGLKSLNADERNSLARDIDLSNEAHRAYVRKAYEQHAHGNLKKFEYFYEAQCVWEDTMAENLTKYLKKNRKKLIAFAGNGHLINKFGIPDRTIKRMPVSMVTIMPYALSETVKIERERADYVWLTADYSPWASED